MLFAAIFIESNITDRNSYVIVDKIDYIKLNVSGRCVYHYKVTINGENYVIDGHVVRSDFDETVNEMISKENLKIRVKNNITFSKYRREIVDIRSDNDIYLDYNDVNDYHKGDRTIIYSVASFVQIILIFMYWIFTYKPKNKKGKSKAKRKR